MDLFCNAKVSTERFLAFSSKVAGEVKPSLILRFAFNISGG